MTHTASTAPPAAGESTSTLPDFEPVAAVEPVPEPEPPTPQPDPPAPPDGDDDIATAEEWAAAGHHKVWLHSGKRIVIRIPDLFTLIQQDAIPEELRAVALNEIETGSATGAATSPSTDAGPSLNWDVVKQAAELYEHIAFHMVFRPEVTLEQFRTFPAEDRDMLRDIAMRRRFTDARGVRLGVEPLDGWARFRHHHRCPEGCEACEAARRDLSSLGAG